MQEQREWISHVSHVPLPSTCRTCHFEAPVERVASRRFICSKGMQMLGAAVPKAARGRNPGVNLTDEAIRARLRAPRCCCCCMSFVVLRCCSRRTHRRRQYHLIFFTLETSTFVRWRFQARLVDAPRDAYVDSCARSKRSFARYHVCYHVSEEDTSRHHTGMIHGIDS